MCSIEEAWGTQTFYDKQVESQADDRMEYMKTPDNLLFPSDTVGPLTKNIPNKNKYTRGIHSQLSRQQRIPNQEHNVRGNNGVIHVKPDVSSMNVNNTYTSYKPAYLDLYNQPLLNDNGQSQPTPSTTKLNNVSPIDVSINDPNYTNMEEGFNVSHTVDNFMNMGMNMESELGPSNLRQNVNNSWCNGVDPNFNNYKLNSLNNCSTNNNMNNVNNMNNMNNNKMNQLNEQQEPESTEELRERMEQNKEILKLLNNVLSRLDTLEKKVNEKKIIQNIPDFCVLVMGSGGRMESYLHPDQDNGIIYDLENSSSNKEQVDKNFSAMVRALRFGTPPHGGIAPGIDRMVMMLANTPNIREVITFPMNQHAQDVLMGAPSIVNPKTLHDLGIKIIQKA